MKSFTAALLLLPLMPAAALAQAPDTASGKMVWEGPTSCKNCHGRAGEGGFGPDLAGRGLSPDQFVHAVRHPWGVMPSFTETQVTDAELANMAAWFAAMPKVAAPAAWKTPVAAGAPHGKVLLANMGCAQCHGANFDVARTALGGAMVDFALFKELVYNHTTSIGPFDDEMRGGPAPAPQPGRPARRIQMGNFNPDRASEAQLKEIYDWARDDIGFKPLLRTTLANSGGATYSLNLVNAGIAGKGLAAEGVTVALAIPSGTRVVKATGEGYKGVRTDAATKTSMAEWQVARLAPKDAQSFTITLSKPATATAQLKGAVRWDKPGPKSGPNTDLANIAPFPGSPPPQ